MNSSKHSLPKIKPRDWLNRSIKLFTIIAVAICLLPGGALEASGGDIYYMIPQGEYKGWFDNGVQMRRTKDVRSFDLRRFSDDNKRWLAVTYSLTDMGPNQGKRLDYHIHTYAGKDYLTELTLYDLSPEGVPEVRWLNDKLIYVEFWWRSTIGGYFIFDADNEYLAVREMMFRGAPPSMAKHPRLNEGRGYQQ